MAAIRRSGRGSGRGFAASLAVLAASFALLGCSPASSSLKQDAAAQPPHSALSLANSITGGWLATRIDANGMPFPNSLNKFQPLIFPTALAVYAQDLYIADAGANRIYRYDKDLQALIPLPRTTATTATRLQAAADRSLYILDPARSVITRLSRGGEVLRTLNPVLATSRFNEFVVDEHLTRIYANDQLNQQLFMLHPMGGSGIPVVWPEADTVRVLGALALGRETLYAIDAASASVLAFTREGRLLGQVGQGSLKQPHALAVDRYNRLYVADRFQRVMKVFETGHDAVTYEYGRLGVTEITALALEHDLLYIADGPGAKVLVFNTGPGSSRGVK